MARHDRPAKVIATYQLVKRLFDFAFALSTLAVLALPMLLIAGLIVGHDGANPLFKQTRVGRHGRPFEILKFRSMVVNAGQLGSYATDVGDKRITSVGHVLRRTSLDELPQLINVLMGDMSLIGPRPDVPAQEALYSPLDWHRRHEVRPGITGLAQASDRSFLTPERRTALDLQYVDHIGPSLDVRIIAMTIGQLLKGGST